MCATASFTICLSTNQMNTAMFDWRSRNLIVEGCRVLRTFHVSNAVVTAPRHCVKGVVVFVVILPLCFCCRPQNCVPLVSKTVQNPCCCLNISHLGVTALIVLISSRGPRSKQAIQMTPLEFIDTALIEGDRGGERGRSTTLNLGSTV